MGIDIGSNDGTLLKQYPDIDLDRVGIDPTGHRFNKYYPANITLIPEFFSATAIKSHVGERKARVITSIAMFYDLEAPMDFVREVCELLADDGLWVFEQSYLPTMIDMNSYDTVCHEHLEFYTLHQIKWMTDQADLKIVHVVLNDVNGGSFSITAAHMDSAHAEATALIESILEQEKRQAMRIPLSTKTSNDVLQVMPMSSKPC